MSPRLIDVSAVPGSGGSLRVLAIVIAIVVVLLIGNPITVVPAGHVGVKDFFGNVSPDVLMPGVRVVIPFTRVVKMSVKTQEIKETAMQLAEVQAVFTTAGDPDALVWLQVPDVERLGHVIEQLRRRGRVTGTKTLIVLDTWSRHRALEANGLPVPQ